MSALFFVHCFEASTLAFWPPPSWFFLMWTRQAKGGNLWEYLFLYVKQIKKPLPSDLIKDSPDSPLSTLQFMVSMSKVKDL